MGQTQKGFFYEISKLIFDRILFKLRFSARVDIAYLQPIRLQPMKT
jgi:hypothetical protein